MSGKNYGDAMRLIEKKKKLKIKNKRFLCRE